MTDNDNDNDDDDDTTAEDAQKKRQEDKVHFIAEERKRRKKKNETKRKGTAGFFDKAAKGDNEPESSTSDASGKFSGSSHSFYLMDKWFKPQKDPAKAKAHKNSLNYQLDGVIVTAMAKNWKHVSITSGILYRTADARATKALQDRIKELAGSQDPATIKHLERMMRKAGLSPEEGRARLKQLQILPMTPHAFRKAVAAQTKEAEKETATAAKKDSKRPAAPAPAP